MREDLGTYPEQAMSWYALSLAYLFGLAANAYPLHAFFCLFVLYSISLSKEKLFYILTILCFIFGLIYGKVPQMPDLPTWYVDNGENTFQAEIVSVKSLSDRRWSVIVQDIKPNHADSDISSKPLEGKGLIYFYCDKNEDFIPPLKGMKIDFTAKLKKIKFTSNPHILNGEQSYFDKGIFYTASLNPQYSKFSFSGKADYFAKLRMDLIQAYIARCKDEKNKVSQGHAFLLGILFGEKFYFDTPVTNLFAKASLIHTLALSGMHLAFVVLCSFCIIKAFSYCMPTLFLKYPKTLLIGLFSIPLAFIYLWLGNFAISLMRAVFMLFVMWICALRYKNFSLLDCLCLVATLLLLIYPRAWADISFQLSVLAVLSIALSSPLFNAFRNVFARKSEDYHLALHKKILFYALALAWTSFCIQIFLFPIQAYTFGTVSPYFFLNIIWIPLVELFVLPFSFLGLFTLPIDFLSSKCIFLASYITSHCIDFLQYINKEYSLKMWQAYRFSLWQGIGFYLFFIACLVYKKSISKAYNRAYMLFLLAFICLFSAPIYNQYDNYIAKQEQRVQIHVLSVGQGQALLLEWYTNEGKKRAIIDAGGLYGERFDTGRDIVAKVLSYQSFAHLDYLIVSHFDLDHVKGMFHLVEHFNIGEFIHSKYDKEKDLKTALLAKVRANNIPERLVEANDIIVLEEDILYLEVLFPPAKGNFSSNNASIILRLVHNDKGIALFTGDIENSGIRRLLALKPNVEADLLVLPHHGSKSSYYEEFYALINPSKVIASNGLYNRYQYPDPRIVEYFKNKNIEVLSTGNVDAQKYIYTKSDLNN